jgi:hypothetical protein
MHSDRIKILEDLAAELRGLPGSNYQENQVAQNLLAMIPLLHQAEALRHKDQPELPVT